MRDHFLLDPDVVFLNHGSFGACPAPVFAEYQRWQRELERQPVEFLGRRADTLLGEVRAALATYLHTVPENLILVPNASHGVNLVAKSLRLTPGDEILTTQHEYGANDHLWDYLAAVSGVKIVRQDIPLPVTTHADFVDQLWQGVTPRTKMIFISHLTSPTALIFPIADICRRARGAGILTLIDGAHAPGQIPVDLAAIDADFYTGNLHKWLCAPKGTAFLYARPDQQAWLRPLVVSWGWAEGADFVTRNQWQGTRDISAFLTIPAAIRFQAEHDWPAQRERCHELARQTRIAIGHLTCLAPLHPDSPEWYAQMVAAPLPDDCDLNALKTALYDKYRIEIPVITWGGWRLIRASFQAYNTPADLAALVGALKALL